MNLGPYTLGPDGENRGIYTGDARELAKAIPDESVDLIFTDPVYQRIDDYRWLAETAARVLKPTGNCLVWFAQVDLPKIVRAMTIEGLDFWYQLVTYLESAPSARIWMGFAKYRPCLWYVPKDRQRHQHETIDVVVSETSGPAKYHQWQKSYNAVLRWTRDLTDATAIIFDPFTGGGTVPAVCKMLGRRWLAFEIDPATADKARERVRLTQPPLFVPEPQQVAMFEEDQ